MNEIDDKKLLNYLKDENITSEEVSYLKRLYKVYKILYSLCNGNIEKNKHLVDKLEDEIYKTKKGELDKTQRIYLELIKIKKKFDKSSPEKQKIASIYMQEARTIINDNTFDDEEIISYVKKLFTIIQLILDMDITFYYSSYLVLKEKYRNLELNNEKIINYTNINKLEKINKKEYKNDKFK